LNSEGILFVSNCFGEDRVASLIAKEFKFLCKQHKKSIRIYGATLMGNGREYTVNNIELVYHSPLPPSGGFPTKSIKGFFADLISGSFFNILKFVKALKKLYNEIDTIFVVGDIFLLFLSKLALKNKKFFFFALAKSDYFMPHYLIEKWFLKTNNIDVLTRDELTAKNFQSDGIKAYYFGNPMMDNLFSKGLNVEIPEDKRVIGILPGSRFEAYGNFKKILFLIDKIERNDLFYIAALPHTLDVRKIIDISLKSGFSVSQKGYITRLKKDLKEVLLLYDSFVEVINLSEIIIGLAGTANEQAAGLGKPVITFKGCGPQSTEVRLKEQEKLLGGASKYIKNFPYGVIREIEFLLDNSDEVELRGRIGKERMGGPGGAKKIAGWLFSKIFSLEEN